MQSKVNKYELRPYVQIEGAYSITDTGLKYIFAEMEKHDLVKKVFCSGTVQAVKQWIQYLKLPRNVVHTIWTDQKEIATIAWVNDFGKNFAFAHFCMFPCVWGKDTLTMGRMSLDYWFGFKKDDQPVLEIILAQHPETLRDVTLFIRRLGMTVVGVIPKLSFDYYNNRSVGTIISYIEREGYLNG